MANDEPIRQLWRCVNESLLLSVAETSCLPSRMTSAAVLTANKLDQVKLQTWPREARVFTHMCGQAVSSSPYSSNRYLTEDYVEW